MRRVQRHKRLENDDVMLLRYDFDGIQFGQSGDNRLLDQQILADLRCLDRARGVQKPSAKSGEVSFSCAGP
jgi:hypothetical protein